MNRKFYLDTSIWRDYFEDRGDLIRPLGEFVFQFLRQCREHGCTILYAEPVLFELKQRFLPDFLEDAFSSLADMIVEVPFSQVQIDEAKTISTSRNLPFNDVLHAIIARDNGAIMVTRDKDFEALADIVESQMPEEIIFY